jgi:hypothetical protein
VTTSPPSTAAMRATVSRMTISPPAATPWSRDAVFTTSPIAVKRLEKQPPRSAWDSGKYLWAPKPQSSPSSRRSLTYLAMICGVMCGMPLSGPTFASRTAARNRSVGAIDPLIGFSGFW